MLLDWLEYELNAKRVTAEHLSYLVPDFPSNSFQICLFFSAERIMTRESDPLSLAQSLLLLVQNERRVLGLHRRRRPRGQDGRRRRLPVRGGHDGDLGGDVVHARVAAGGRSPSPFRGRRRLWRGLSDKRADFKKPFRKILVIYGKAD